MHEQDKKLTAEQVGVFCRMAGLDASRVVFRGNGAHRDVLLADGKVYIFPRAKRYHESMCRELEFLRQAARMERLPMPRFVEMIDCPAAYPAPVGVLSFLEGDNWEDIQESFSWEYIQAVWDEMLEILLACHALPVKLSPVAAGNPPLPFSETSRMQAWLAASLDAATAAAAVEGLQGELVATAAELGVDFSAIAGADCLAAWTQTLLQLGNLPPALLHGDMHEGQVLLLPDRRPTISGILDWEAVQVGNPLMDFSFHKWGWGRIWVFREHFAAWRRGLWTRYLAGRSIAGHSPGGLHLYCSLTEALRTLIERQAGRKLAVATRKPYPESLAQQFVELREATEAV